MSPLSPPTAPEELEAEEEEDFDLIKKNIDFYNLFLL
jgi:hypothetical protein